jgi:hypothetical protein
MHPHRETDGCLVFLKLGSIEKAIQRRKGVKILDTLPAELVSQSNFSSPEGAE